MPKAKKVKKPVDKKTKEATENSMVSDTETKSFIHPKHFSKFDLLFFAAIFAVIGGFIIWKSFAASNTVIPTYDYVAQPYTDDGSGQCHQSIWALGKSPTTPYISPDSARHAQRYILANPNATDSAGNRGSDEWWFMFNQYFDSSYTTARPGYANSFFNLHNVAGDNGPSGGVGWGFGSGVSSFHLLNNGPNGSPGSYMLIENDNSRSVTIPTPALNQWHSYVVHLIFGRNDGSTPRAGMAEVWMDGNKVATVSNTNTLQRAKGPDGNTYTQQWLQLWQGTYTQGAPCRSDNNTPVSGKLNLARIGKTSTEANNDVPQYDGNIATEHISGQPNYGNSSLTLASPQLTVGSFVLPAALGGSTSPSPTPPPAPTPTPTPTPTPPAPTPLPPAPQPTPASPPATPVTFTSNIKDGATVANGYSWTASFSSIPASVEFWANSIKLATDTEAPFSTIINLPLGTNKLGLCYTVNSIRTCTGTGGTLATITVTAAPAPPPPAPTPTPTPTPTPPPAPVTYTSSIVNGQTVANGTAWNATVSTLPSSVEFWANSVKLATDTTLPFSTVINLPVGTNKLGFCYTISSIRTCNGPGGTIATITVTQPVAVAPTPTVDITKPSTPANFRVTSTGKNFVKLAWDKSTDNVGVTGYRLDRSLQTIYSGPSLSITNTNLSANSAYVYQVSAYDKAGNRSGVSKRVCLGKWTWWSNVTKSRGWQYC